MNARMVLLVYHIDMMSIVYLNLNASCDLLEYKQPVTVLPKDNTLYNRTSWQTHHALSSDHLPTMTTINIRHNFRLQTYRRTFTNYKKANWTQFTKDTELAFSLTTIPDDIHTANRMFTNVILLADKHNIPKGKMPNPSRLLPEHIVCKITQRDNIRRANPCDPALKPLNHEITSDISLRK